MRLTRRTKIVSDDGTEFDVHLFVMVALSDYFKALKENPNCEEIKNGAVTLDMSAKTIKGLLALIYEASRTHSFSLKELIEILKAVDYLQMTTFKLVLVDTIKESLRKSNAIEVAIVADTVNAVGLRKAAVEILVANFHELRLSKEWNEMLANYPSLMKEINFPGVKKNRIPECEATGPFLSFN